MTISGKWTKWIKARTLAMAGAFLLTGSALSGCVIESSGPSNVCGPSEVTLTWVVEGSAGPVPCSQVGAAYVYLYVNDTPYQFSCSAYAGRTTAITGGATYNIGLTLTDASNHVLSQTQTMSAYVPCDSSYNLGEVPFGI